MKLLESMCCDAEQEAVQKILKDFEHNIGDADYFKDR